MKSNKRCCARIIEKSNGTALIKSTGKVEDRTLALSHLRRLIGKTVRAKRLGKRQILSTPFGAGFIKQNGDVTIGCQQYSYLNDIFPFAKKKGWV